MHHLWLYAGDAKNAASRDALYFTGRRLWRMLISNVSSFVEKLVAMIAITRCEASLAMGDAPNAVCTLSTPSRVRFDNSPRGAEGSFFMASC